MRSQRRLPTQTAQGRGVREVGGTSPSSPKPNEWTDLPGQFQRFVLEEIPPSLPGMHLLSKALRAEVLLADNFLAHLTSSSGVSGEEVM